MANNTDAVPRLNRNTLLNIYRGGTQYPTSRVPGGPNRNVSPRPTAPGRPSAPGSQDPEDPTAPPPASVAGPPTASTGGDAGNNWTGGSVGSAGYADPYDDRIGAGALPFGISGTQNRAYTRQPTSEELVENRMNNLLSGNSVYMQNARQYANEAAANRGLLNSSIAVGAAQRAAIDSALPIASQDAATWSGAQAQNVQVLNERAIADLRAAVDRASIGAGITIAGMNNAGALQRQRENLAFSGEQNELDRNHQNLRDYNMYRYDVGRDAVRSQLALRERRSQFGYDLIDLAASNPELFTPEVIGSFYNTFGPLLDFDLDEFDQFLASIGIGGGGG